MTFFQNPFVSDFRGRWLLDDSDQSLSFECPRNMGRGDDLVLSWADGPFDLSGNDTDGDSQDTLQIRFALGPNFDRWSLLSVDVTTAATSTSAVTHSEIIEALNDDSSFAGWFTASKHGTGRVQIKSKKDQLQFRFYIVNGRAEEALQFNVRSGIAELPTYFDRHKLVYLFDAADRKRFNDNQNILIPLDPSSSNVDAAVIDNAVDAFGTSKGFDSSTVQDDWQLLKGKSPSFTFQKITVDASNRITEIIKYQAGARAGDLAHKTTYSYTSANTNPDQITEVPYTLASGDLVTP